MTLLATLVVAGFFGTCPDQPAKTSYLYQPAFCTEDELRLPAEPYCPQPGDIFLATDYRPIMQFGHKICGAKNLHRSGIVVALPDGRLALAEAGPFDKVEVCLSELLPQLRCYDDKEKVWIRRRAVPLTPEESACLTEFAVRQCGKRFAVWRLLAQCTPFRCRGPLRTYVVGKPHGDRCSYFCSEFVMECCVAAGILDPARTRPPATYPCDLFYGTSRNLFLKHHLDINCGWLPPARWTDCPEPDSRSQAPPGNEGR